MAQRKEEERREKEAARAQAYTQEYEEDRARAAAAAGRREVNIESLEMLFISLSHLNTVSWLGHQL